MAEILIMSSFSNTLLPPTLRLGDTADPIMTVPRNTATVVTRAALVRPLIERSPKPSGIVIELKRPVVRRPAKRTR
jgi:hypothetical protein